MTCQTFTFPFPLIGHHMHQLSIDSWLRLQKSQGRAHRCQQRKGGSSGSVAQNSSQRWIPWLFRRWNLCYHPFSRTKFPRFFLVQVTGVATSITPKRQGKWRYHVETVVLWCFLQFSRFLIIPKMASSLARLPPLSLPPHVKGGNYRIFLCGSRVVVDPISCRNWKIGMFF